MKELENGQRRNNLSKTQRHRRKQKLRSGSIGLLHKYFFFLTYNKHDFPNLSLPVHLDVYL